MKSAPLLLAIAALAAGCAAQLDGPNIEELANTGFAESGAYRPNSTFAALFEELIAGWNKLAGFHVLRTEQGFLVYVDGSLNLTRPDCSGKMEPAFGCNDILVERPPLGEHEIKAGDVVSFSIDGGRAQLFGEEPFSGERQIYRRIFIIADDGQYIMKRDGVATRADARISFGDIRSKVVGFIFDAAVGESGLEPYAGTDRSVKNYNELVSGWNSFAGSVYRAGTDGRYELYYDRRLGVTPLACTGSMRPAIDCGDLVLTYRPAAEKELAVGDIVSFRIAPNETSGLLGSGEETFFVMHRIFRIDERDGRTVFITKGDNTETNSKLDNIPLDFGRIESRAAAYFKESFGETFAE